MKKPPLTFGSLAAFLFLLECLTGAGLMVYYRPVPEWAYADMVALREVVSFGIIRDLHFWAGHLLILTVFLHLLHAFFNGAYKPPKGRNWVLGVALLVLTLLMGFTGRLLNWDQDSFWGAVVAARLADALPLIGHKVRLLVLADTAVSGATLLRFYAFHCAILPLFAAVLIAVHVVKSRRDGSESGPPSKTALLIVFILLLIFSMFVKAPLAGPADPSSSPNPVKSAWYFLFIQELLVYFKPWLAGIVLPFVCVLGLALLPRLERFRAVRIVFPLAFLLIFAVPAIIAAFFRGPDWALTNPFKRTALPALRAPASLGLLRHKPLPLLAEETQSAPVNEYCLTCHTRPHSNPGLYADGNSAHPAGRFGCVACHNGQRGATGFVSSGHAGGIDEFRIFPLKYTEASCLECHDNRFYVPQAGLLNRGKELFASYGCAGCHAIEYAAGLPKTGPDLSGLAKKAGPGWVAAWIRSPQKIKPETRMPDALPDSNEIANITTFLAGNGKQLPPARGSVLGGEKLFKTVGCLACHSVEPGVTPLAVNLRGSGDKLDFAWLDKWLKKPVAMPDFRLGEKERTDLSAFILAQKTADGLPWALPAASRQDGEKAIRYYGCYGCHSIAGMEGLPPVGSSLDREGDKRLKDLDFGALEGKIPKERWAYFEQVLTDPRAFDRRIYDERLRMPRFNFTDDQKKALVCFILAQRRTDAKASIRVRASADDSAMLRGEGIILSRRCNGCHVTYPGGSPRGGAIKACISDSVMVPPFLYLEGKKVRGEWLYGFLDSVTVVRPWLNVRMPAFRFSPDTLDILVKHFEAEAGPSGIEAYFDPDRVPRARLKLGEKLFRDFKCVTCHVDKGKLPKRPRDQWAPDIALTKKRMRVEWCTLWLKDPQKYVPGTRMPSYFYDYDEAEKTYAPLIPDAENALMAMRDYLFAP